MGDLPLAGGSGDRPVAGLFASDINRLLFNARLNKVRTKLIFDFLLLGKFEDRLAWWSETTCIMISASEKDFSNVFDC